MKTKPFFVAAILLSVLSSCNQNSTKDQSDIAFSELKTLQAPPEPGNKQEPIPVGNNLQDEQTDSTQAPTPVTKIVKPTAVVDWDKKIIKTAGLTIEVKDFKSYNDKVHQTVKQFGGYIAQEEQHLSPEKSETVISIKVPVAQFEDMVNQLPASDSKVMERKITSEDVTDQVVDTKSRLEAKKQMRLKYLDFLKQSKNMEEVLQVQNEINSIQEEIEAASGRIVYLSHQSALSTINLTFYQPMTGYTPSDEKPGFGSRIAAAFKTGASWVGELFIGLISIWPLLLVVFIIWAIWKKFNASQKTPASS